MVRSRMKEKNKRKLSQLQLENNFILSIRKGLMSPYNNIHRFILLFVSDDNVVLHLIQFYFSYNRIQVVNLTQSEITALTSVLTSYSCVLGDKWIKNLTYAFRVKTMNKVTMIKLISEILIHLHKRGWNPLTPVTMGNDEKKMMITICFEKSSSLRKSSLFSITSNNKRGNVIIPQETLCCSIECNGQTMTLHSLPATVISELVTICQDDILAVSTGVMSIISDYLSHDIPVINANGLLIKFKRNQKKNKTEDNNTSNHHIIACLSRAGYKLSVVIYFGAKRSVYFFIVDSKHSEELRQLNKQIAGLGLKDSLTSYQPIINRRKSSFFRSFNGRASLKKRVRQSLHRKLRRDSSKSISKKLEWYQQTSTDIGTDCEYEDLDDNDDDGEYGAC